MTIAICLRCGAKKHGAFTPCPQCNFLPETSEDFAKSLLLSDNQMIAEELETASQQKQAGKNFQFDEAVVRELSSQIDPARFKRDSFLFSMGCLLIPLGIMFAIYVIIWFLI